MPARDEVDDVVVLQRLDQVDLLLDARPVRRGQLAEGDRVPGDLEPRLVVDALVDDFVGAAPQLVVEALEAALGRLLGHALLLAAIFVLLVLVFVLLVA